jgi:mevalonate pyrophosphate decarboxylase
MASYNFSLNDEKMWERYALINLMYKKLYNLNQNIKIQLALPREALNKFGGVYDIVRFREMCKEKSIKMMSFPIISIQTYLEEMNLNNADNNSSQGPTQSEVKTYLDKVNNQYKLSRDKTMVSKNTLEFCMGLKKV